MVLAKRVSLLLVVAVFWVSSMAFAALKMPEELNAEFTQYPDSKIVSTHTTADAVVAVLDVPGADIDAVFDFYKEKATGNGWKIEIESKAEDYQALHMSKNDRVGIIGIGCDADNVTITLSINGQ